MVLKFAKGLQDKGHAVDILCANASPEFLNDHTTLKITQLHIPNSNSMAYWFLFPYWQYKINKRLKDYPDYILFPHVLPSNWWAWAYKKKHPEAKVVWYCHEPSAFIHSKTWINAIPHFFVRTGAKILNPLLKIIDRNLEKESNAVICNSRFTMEAYKKAYHKTPGAIVYPPSLIKAITPLRNKENYLLAVCRVTKFKNVDLLIDAFKTIAADFPDYKLLIAGDGEEKENLEKRVASLGLEDKVLFLGWTVKEQLEDLYLKAKLTVSYSMHETFGLVPIESMMYGTPVISHNSGGPRETILHGETGFLFDDKDDLLKYWREVLEMSPERYAKMQDRCREEALKYDISSVISSLQDILIRIG